MTEDWEPSAGKMVARKSVAPSSDRCLSCVSTAASLPTMAMSPGALNPFPFQHGAVAGQDGVVLEEAVGPVPGAVGTVGHRHRKPDADPRRGVARRLS